MATTIYRAEYHSGNFPTATTFFVQIINPGESDEVVRVLGYAGGNEVFDTDKKTPQGIRISPGKVWSYQWASVEVFPWAYWTNWVIIHATSQYLVPSIISTNWVGVRVDDQDRNWLRPDAFPNLVCSPGDFAIFPVKPRVVRPGAIGPDNPLKQRRRKPTDE